MPILSKDRKEFIDLRPSKEKMRKEMAPAKVSDIQPTGPNLYISGKDLPLDSKDVGETLTAQVQVKVRRVSTRKESRIGSSAVNRTDYDLEILGIKFID